MSNKSWAFVALAFLFSLLAIVFAAHGAYFGEGVFIVLALVCDYAFPRTLAGPCTAPGCRNVGWWRVILVVRPGKGDKPDPLLRMPVPSRVCGSCRRAMKGGDPRPLREDRKLLTTRLVRRYGVRPDWSRTTNEFEHVVIAELRGRP